MTEPTKPSDSPSPTDPAGAPPADPALGSPPASAVQRLAAYFTANRGRYTDEALEASARAAGHSDETIKAAFERARADAIAAPVRDRARRIVLWAYVVTFIALTAGMAVNNGPGLLASAGILLVSMLIGFALSRAMIRSAGPQAAIAAILAGPVIVLVIVAGLCVATGLPLAPIRF